jgi:hypothetical protein
MQQRRQLSLTDMLLVWGFLLSFFGLLGAGLFEAYKIVAVIPAAFDSAPAVLRNPMGGSEEDYQPNPSGRSRMTAQQRRQYEERAERQER